MCQSLAKQTLLQDTRSILCTSLILQTYAIIPYNPEDNCMEHEHHSKTLPTQISLELLRAVKRMTKLPFGECPILSNQASSYLFHSDYIRVAPSLASPVIT